MRVLSVALVVGALAAFAGQVVQKPPASVGSDMYGGVRGEQDEKTQGPSQAMIDGRKRGVIFDVGHGGGSFKWSTAIPLMKAGFIPDSISTDLHASSMQRRNPRRSIPSSSPM